jgi:hypothetical protein
MAGACQLLEALTATYGQVIVLGKLFAPADPAATAASILGHERLFWFGFTSSIMGVGFHLAWAFLFYELFKVVNRRLSLFAVFVILVGCAIQALTILFYVAPLAVLSASSSLTAFTPDQLHALALMFLRLNGRALDLYLVFFGFWCLLSGWLIFKSTFMPRVLGVLLAISGLGWMVFLWPPFAHAVFFYIAGASALGEVPLELWMLIAGVNTERWNDQASAAAVRT